MRYVLLVSYDGTDFCGWQIQNNGRTVQEVLQTAVYAAFNANVSVTASGRTDSGVHAEGQVCHFDCDLTIPPENIADALNCRLPKDVAVLQSAAAPKGFDSNRSAKKKTYVYRFYNTERRSPLMDRYALHIRGGLDMDMLNQAAEIFMGSHDFKAYCASRSQVKTTVREIYGCGFSSERGLFGEYITMTVCGGGFLYNMVRTMAGTALDFSRGKISEEDIVRSLEEGNRALVGKTLPPNGLALKSVDYGVNLFASSCPLFEERSRLSS